MNNNLNISSNALNEYSKQEIKRFTDKYNFNFEENLPLHNESSNNKNRKLSLGENIKPK